MVKSTCVQVFHPCISFGPVVQENDVELAVEKLAEELLWMTDNLRRDGPMVRWSYFRLSFVVSSLTAAPRVMVPISGSICIIYSVGLGFYFRLREFWFSFDGTNRAVLTALAKRHLP
ncbi:hypothetical protein YC2023_012060 [Brassica napus]